MTTFNSEPYPELTIQKLHEAISLIMLPKEIPIRFEVSYGTERFLKNKLEPTLYNPPTPNTILAHYMGMLIVIDERLPDNAIVFVYRTQQGERKELKVLNLGSEVESDIVLSDSIIDKGGKDGNKERNKTYKRFS